MEPLVPELVFDEPLQARNKVVPNTARVESMPRIESMGPSSVE
jgi:hypothetical protein